MEKKINKINTFAERFAQRSIYLRNVKIWITIRHFITSRNKLAIERFYSRGRHLRQFIGTKESVYIRKEFNSQRIGLEHQHGRRDVMWKRCIVVFSKDL